MSLKLLEGNAIIGQSGGPTAVINQSLVGVVEALRGSGSIKRVFGARHGVRGMVKEDVIELDQCSQEELEEIAAAPSAALGSTRDKPDETYCERIFENFRRHDIRYFFYIGGNDSADTCRIVNQLSNDAGYELRCFHIPKTIDNDLMENDHTPGFPSAARFVALAFIGDNLDNRALPGIKINVVMGRNAGFLTAASCLSRRHEDDGPHLIYVPEMEFDGDRFVADVDRVFRRLGRCQVAISEGIRDHAGNLISAMMSGNEERDAHGNVQLSGSGALGDWLANILRVKLTPKGGKPPRVRADTFGYIQRCWPDASPIDQAEARAAGAKAGMVAIGGDYDGSVAIRRISTIPYETEMRMVKLESVAAKTRVMPPEFLGAAAAPDVSQAFVEYVRPLVGRLPNPARL